METLYRRFKQAVDKNANRPAQWWKSDGCWRSIGYSDVLSNIDHIAAGLVKLGVIKNDRVAILSENRPQWLWFDLAINKIGAVSVPIHTTNTKHAIRTVMIDSEAKFLVVSKNFFNQALMLKSDIAGLKIISIDYSEAADVCLEHLLDIDIVSLIPEDENDLASIIYTSGTTGTPKGVKLTNRNFLFDSEAVCSIFEIDHRDKFLSFLPLSHVLERTAGSYVPIFSGCQIAYAENVQKLTDNLHEVKPTIIICVPKIFERMHEKIITEIMTKKPFVRKIVFWTMSKGGGKFKKLIAERLVYKKIRNVLGGKLRFAVSGGANLNDRILRFFRSANINIVEGYGLTETAPIIAANRLNDIHIGTVGQPIPGIEVIVAEDKEILVRGANVMAGYWKNDEATEEAFFNGWFKTGDLGFIDKDNFLTITGRKKDIIVTSNGKNIYPEKIESMLNLSSYILQSVVVGHRQNFIATLIVPDSEMIAQKFGEKKYDLNKLIFDEIEKINHHLLLHEKIRNFRIMNKEFTVENEELTPTLKIRRRIIEGRYKREIDKMFER